MVFALHRHLLTLIAEALLLLLEVTKSNQEIQKILAFEGTFDILLDIIHEEGLSDGGIIVQDCLCLINNLIRGNVSNQVKKKLQILLFIIYNRTTLEKRVALRSSRLFCRYLRVTIGLLQMIKRTFCV